VPNRREGINFSTNSRWGLWLSFITHWLWSCIPTVADQDAGWIWVFFQDQFCFATIFSVFMHYSSNRKAVSEQLEELHFKVTNIVLTGGWPVLFHPTHISTLVTKATATAGQAVCICTALGDIVAACQCWARFQLHTLCWTQLLMLHTLHSINQHSNCSFVWCKRMCIITYSHQYYATEGSKLHFLCLWHMYMCVYLGRHLPLQYMR